MSTSTTAPGAKLTEAERDALRALAGRFGVEATDAQIDAGVVVFLEGDEVDLLAEIDAEFLPEDPTELEEMGRRGVRFLALRVEAGGFRAPSCPPGATVDGACPPVRGDTAIQIDRGDLAVMRTVRSWADLEAGIDALLAALAGVPGEADQSQPPSSEEAGPYHSPPKLVRW